MPAKHRSHGLDTRTRASAVVHSQTLIHTLSLSLSRARVKSVACGRMWAHVGGVCAVVTPPPHMRARAVSETDIHSTPVFRVMTSDNDDDDDDGDEENRFKVKWCVHVLAIYTCIRVHVCLLCAPARTRTHTRLHHTTTACMHTPFYTQASAHTMAHCV